ncbi:MAG: thiamine pyrophosphate-dependent dehydrogenase E1 component subunit alpha [Actinobacteria bacterium]|nr:thiamine pyrophosphate-dependent dehydrogenase E1 component subunit alpha [Actinomycetota bacterium]
MEKLKTKKTEVKVSDVYDIQGSFQSLPDRVKVEMLEKMYQIRHFEAETEQFIIKGQIHGTCHLYVGEEATAVGAIYALAKNDYITSTHRGHGHCIAKGADLNRMMTELLGKATGYCKGKGGSMHIADVTTGNLGANGIVGGSIDIATGAALTCKIKENGKIVACFFGDGAANRGNFHGALNMASIWDLPVIYICENNQYGMSMPVKESFNIARISERKHAYNMVGITIDGNDIVQVYNTIRHFADHCRSGKGPVLVECLTYRWKGHSKSDAQVYRTKEEVKTWIEKDPIVRYRNVLLKEGLISEKDDREIEAGVIEQLKQANKFAEESPFPDLSQVEEDVYA